MTEYVPNESSEPSPRPAASRDTSRTAGITAPRPRQFRVALDLPPGSRVYRDGVVAYTIGQTAERSGFSASALRYYENIKLVFPAGRTEAGYRLYDDAALARLRFIDRARQLGCSLEEIRDLVAIWDGGRCGPVQRRFHELVTAKLADARRKIDELTAFTVQLRTAVTYLAEPAVDGPCGDDCACVAAASVPTTGPVPISLGSKPTGPVSGTVACTLTADDVPERLEDWRRVLDHARARTTTAARALRVELDEGIEVADLARLVAAEQRCCAFLAFAITIDSRGVALEIDAPDGSADLVTELFGTADVAEEDG